MLPTRRSTASVAAAYVLSAFAFSVLPNVAIGHDPVDLTRLPIGDGKLSNGPEVGSIWPCMVNPNAGGSHREGAWMNRADGTFDLTAKATVDGQNTWPYRFSVRRDGGTRIIETNNLPNHPTGSFPVSQQDDAYLYDRNPGRIVEKNFTLRLPADPTQAASPSCVPPGVIGFLLTGSALFSALDGPGRDAVAHEIQDSCGGHPERTGVYHYHSMTSCQEQSRQADGHSDLIGYAVDGFGIFGPKGEGGAPMVSADLGECHGHSHEIDWDGTRKVLFHYHATPDFPYTIGCLRGGYDQQTVRAMTGGPGGGGLGQGPGNAPRGGRPDLNAAAARLGVDVQRLRRALGPPPPNFRAAAAALGVSERQLRDALGAP